MPAYTVNSIRSQFRQMYPDCTEAEALDHLNAVHNQVLSRVPLVWDTHDVTLAAGTGTYSLEAGNILRVWGVAYLSGSNTAKMLQERQYYELIVQNAIFETTLAIGNLATDENGTWYLKPGTGASSGLTLGLSPRPDTTTGGGFPIIRMFVTKYQALTAGATFYEDIPNEDVYVLGMAARYSKRRRREQSELYEAAYQMELEKVIQFFREKQGGNYSANFLAASMGR